MKQKIKRNCKTIIIIIIKYIKSKNFKAVKKYIKLKNFKAVKKIHKIKRNCKAVKKYIKSKKIQGCNNKIHIIKNQYK